MSTVYIYLDESGNLDFTDKGTKHFVLCAMITPQVLKTHGLLHQLKHKLLEQGDDIENFHATEDKQAVRDQVFRALAAGDCLEFHYVYADKRSLPEELKDRVSFYSRVSTILLEHCFRLPVIETAGQVIVIFDKVFRKKERTVLEALVKSTLSRMDKTHRLYFHRIICDFNAQIADYGAWSFFVQLERKEERPMQALRRFKSSTQKFAPDRSS